MYLFHLPDLALMTSLDVPLDILSHPWPPKPIPQTSQHREDPLVSEIVVGLLDKSVASFLVRNPLVAPLRLLLPQLVVLEEELRGLGHETLPLLLVDFLGLLPLGDTT